MKREWAAPSGVVTSMSTNPLFTNNPVRPEPADDAAVRLIRAKVSKIYGEEPSASAELAEVEHEKAPSKHQKFMQELSQSGKDIAEIQVAWHRYYTGLPDADKREVWEEFYAANEHTPYQKLFQKQTPVPTRTRLAAPTQGPASSTAHTPPRVMTSENGVTIADHTPLKSSAQMQSSRFAETIQSLLFGLGVGTVMLLVLLFGFFNEFIITPFITPSANAKDIPVIMTDITSEQAANPTVIVPKIGIQIPVDFTLNTTDEAAVENSLNNGVVHYASTALPGQNGNAALFGHSSQNIFNSGKYKFAFVRLRELTTGDIFYITYQGKTYGYQVFAREIVPPTQISVLTDTKGEQATAVLITCDPPGFSTNRLVVWGKQISPSPSQNTAPTNVSVPEPQKITSSGPTLWTRMWRNIQFWR